MLDADDINLINKEERVYQAWVRERKAQILSMSNVKRKQEEWKKLFPPFIFDDSYLEGEIF